MRIKSGKPVIKSWEEVENKLKEMAELEAELASETAEMEAVIAEAKLTFNVVKSGLEPKIKTILRDLELYCEYHRDEFGESRTRVFPFGKLGFRQSTGKVKALSGWTEKMSLAKLIEKRKEAFVDTKRTLSKKSIIDYFNKEKVDNDYLAQFGLEVVKSDEFWCETKNTTRIDSGAVMDQAA